MSRRQSVVIRSAFMLLAATIVIIAIVMGGTQTTYGQNQLRKLVNSFLAGKVNGKVYVGRIHGGFLGGVILDSLEIRDKQDSLFLATGPIRVQYDIRDIMDRRVLIRYLEAEHPIIYIKQHENEKWNWREIFPEGAPSREKRKGFGDFIVIDSALIKNGKFTLTLPWRLPDSLKGRRKDSALRAELTNPAHEIRQSREGLMRTWRWTRADVTLGYARIADPDSIGRFFRVRKANVLGADPPFDFTNAVMDVKHLGDSVWLDSPHFDLPGSTGRAKGKVIWGSNLPVRYAIHVIGDSVSMSDVAWVYPTLPTIGGGKMELDIISEPKNPHITDYRITKMDVRSTQSRLLGTMTYAVGGDVLGVKDVQLVADPVDFKLLRTLNGKPFPYDWEGKITGTVHASGGPLTHFKVEQSDLTFSDAHVPGAISVLSGRGELNIFYPAFTEFHGFNVSVTRFDLRTPQFLNPLFPRLHGWVSGTATLDSSWLDVRFRNADMFHHDGAAPISHVTGKGRVIWGEKYLTYDLDLHAEPLWLTTMSLSYPVLPLRGGMTGPIRVRGTSENLNLVTSLSGPSGAFSFDGFVDADPPVYGAKGAGTLANLDLHTLIAGRDMPDSKLNGQYAIDVSGATADKLAGTIAADVRQSVVDGMPVERALAQISVSDGVATVDSLLLRGRTIHGNASGTFAIAPGKSGLLKFDLAMDSLAAARPYLRATGLQIAALDTLRGTLLLRGEVAGSPGRLKTRASLESSHFAYGQRQAGSLQGEFTFGGDSTSRSGIVHFSGSDIAVSALRFAKGEGTATLEPGGRTVIRATLSSGNGITTSIRGGSVTSHDTTVIALDTLRIAGESIGSYSLAGPATAVVTKNGLVLDSLILRDSSKARLALRNVRMEGDSIRGSVRTAGVDLALLSAFTPTISDARGAMSAELDISGTVNQPEFNGEFKVAEGWATASNLGTRLEHINADISLARDTIFVKQLSAETSKEERGSVAVEGYVGLEQYKNPYFSLEMTARNFRAVEKAGLASVDISTPIPVTLTGSYENAVVRGAIRVDRGTLYIPELIQKKIVDLSDPDFAALADTLLPKNRNVLPSAPSEFAKNLSLENLALQIGEDVWLRSSEANIQLGGSLNVTLGPSSQRPERTQLALDGTLNALKGTYRLNLVDPFVQPTFDVESGTLRFFGTPDLNPSLNIRAIHTVRRARQSVAGTDVRVRVTIGGTLAEPRLTLDNPDNLPLSESDLLSYLVTGEPAFALDNTSTEYRSQLASFAVRYGGTLLTNAIPHGALDILELQTVQFRNPTQDQKTSEGYYNLLNTRAILGKQIGARWYLGLSTGLCVVNRENFLENLGLKLEYRFNTVYTVEGGIEPGISDRTCARTTSASSFQQTPSQRGLDFFRTWRF